MRQIAQRNETSGLGSLCAGSQARPGHCTKRVIPDADGCDPPDQAPKQPTGPSTINCPTPQPRTHRSVRGVRSDASEPAA